MSDAHLSATVHRLDSLLVDVIAFASALDDADTATALTEHAGRRNVPTSVVVVAGESGVGKSWLVQALTDQLPDLQEETTPTQVYVVVEYAKVPRAEIQLTAPTGSTSKVQVGVADDVMAWASELAADGETSISRVVVGLPHRLLESGLVLVDTPGIGGLDSARAAVTMEALKTADAFIFVTGAAAPLSGPEVTFIEEAARRIGTIAIVCAKRDRHRGWRTTVQENVVAVERHAGITGTRVFPVSSLLYFEAAVRELDADLDVASALRAESGLVELTRWLEDEVLGRAQQIRLRNLTNVLAKEVDRLEAMWRVAADHRDTDRRFLAELGRREQGLERLRRSNAIWQRRLADAIQQLDLSLRREANRHASIIQQQFDRVLAPNATFDIATMPATLELDAEAIGLRLTAQMRDGTRLILEDLAELLAFDGLEVEAVGSPLPDPRTAAEPVAPDKSLPLEPAMAAVASGLALRYLVWLLPIPGATVIGLGAGVALGGYMWIRRKRMALQAESRAAARLLLRDHVDWLRTDVPGQCQSALLRLRGAVEEVVRARVDARSEELAAAIKDLTARVEESASNRRRLQAEASRNLDALSTFRQRVDEIRFDLAESTSAPEVLPRNG